MTKIFENYEVICFSDLLKEDRSGNGSIIRSLDHLEFPGILGIHCFPAKYTLIIRSDQVADTIRDAFADLYCNAFTYEMSDQLVRDVDRYGAGSLAFLIFQGGREWADEKKQENEYHRIRNS